MLLNRKLFSSHYSTYLDACKSVLLAQMYQKKHDFKWFLYISPIRTRLLSLKNVVRSSNFRTHDILAQNKLLSSTLVRPDIFNQLKNCARVRRQTRVSNFYGKFYTFFSLSF